jgi:hypothetical protein
MALDEIFLPGKKLSANVGEGAVGGEMTRESSGIAGIPGNNLVVNDLANRGFVGRDLPGDGDGRNHKKG